MYSVKGKKIFITDPHGFMTDRLNTKDGSVANAGDVSRGVFGANVGVDRLLKFFDARGIKATWFMPSHTILSFPDQMAKVRDGGHEM
jgi:peptidoglycan/xylan/chitin deacetylase (PgdA/CDA1 family)